MGFGHLGRYSLGAEEVTPPLSLGGFILPQRERFLIRKKQELYPKYDNGDDCLAGVSADG